MLKPQERKGWGAVAEGSGSSIMPIFYWKKAHTLGSLFAVFMSCGAAQVWGDLADYLLLYVNNVYYFITFYCFVILYYYYYYCYYLLYITLLHNVSLSLSCCLSYHL